VRREEDVGGGPHSRVKALVVVNDAHDETDSGQRFAHPDLSSNF
jgi:hypothetical protein